MYVPLIFFVFAGVVMAAFVVNRVAASLTSRWGNSLVGASSFATGIAAAAFAVSIVTPRVTLADGEGVDKSSEAKSAAAAPADSRTTDTPAVTDAPSLSESQTPSIPSQGLSVSPELAEDPLHTAPLATIQIDREKRPAWVESAANQIGDIHTISVKGGPYPSQRECLRALDAELKKATNEYIAEHLGNSLAPELLNYDLRKIKERLVGTKVYDEIIVSPLVGEMRQTHALVQFDNDFRSELDLRWNQIKAASRLGQVGLGVGAALALLTTFFGYLRMDTATRGYYTGRLQFAAATTILAIVAAGVVVAKMIPWQ